jgi:oligoendopeptidase F
MPTLARFEDEVYRRAESGKPLTAEILNNLMADMYAEGYGTTMSDDRDRTAITWAQFGHLYRPYYTFQYAIGLSAAHALADNILSGEPGAAEGYLRFLKTGGSQYPLETFRQAGVDMTTPEPVERTFKILEGLVDRLEILADSR